MVLDIILQFVGGFFNGIFFIASPLVYLATFFVAIPSLIFWASQWMWSLSYLYIFAPSFGLITTTEFGIYTYFSVKQIANFIRGSGA